MLSIKNNHEIKERIRDTEYQLMLIEEAMARETGRGFFKRRIGICRFLDIEKKVFAAKLNELKWMIYEQ